MPELVETALKPLWECWAALLAARNKREPLELDLPERRVVLDEKGRIMSVAPRERLDAHRLVEDYMIAANVAAAKALEKKKAPVMYRIHEAPGRDKLTALKDYLATFGVEFALGQVIKPGTFNHILDRVGEHDARPEIMEQVLRTQMQARYGPEALGHFGLALPSYAHFTSPIRRYADLLVHRALVTAYKLGEGGLPGADAENFAAIGEAISMLERRAMEAERDTIDRYVAAFLADRVGQILPCRISGVQSFGFFATVEGLGGDGLVPAAILGQEYFRYDEKARALIGDDTGTTFRQGQKIDLKLAEANPASGRAQVRASRGQIWRRARAAKGARTASAAAPSRGGPPPRGRPANIRHQGASARELGPRHRFKRPWTKHKIAIVVGSLRKDSSTARSRRRCAASPPTGSTARSSRSATCPCSTRTWRPTRRAEWVAFKQAIAAADGILFVTPEYNRTIPGALKNAIDVGSRPYGKSAWEKKPAAIVTASPGGIGGFGCNHQLRQACVFLDMPVMQQPEAYLGGVSDKSFAEDGSIADPALAKVVKRLATAFADWVGLIRSGRAALAGDPAHQG